MKRIIDNIGKLIDVKTIVTLSVVGTTCYLALIGNLEVETFMTITGIIITFYFTKDRGKEE